MGNTPTALKVPPGLGNQSALKLLEQVARNGARRLANIMSLIEGGSGDDDIGHMYATQALNATGNMHKLMGDLTDVFAETGDNLGATDKIMTTADDNAGHRAKGITMGLGE
jgi:hypothetical protein